MIIDIKFPVMARVQRKGQRGEHRMVVSHVHSHEIAEVSSAETELALPPVKPRAEKWRSSTLPELRLHGGRLYRYLRPVDPRSNHLFRIAYELEAWGTRDYYATQKSHIDPQMGRNPLARPIQHLIENRLSSLAMDGEDSKNRTWPHRTLFWYSENERLFLKNALEECSSVNSEDLDECYAMHRSQSEKLLKIDDGIWYETKPPCIEVDTSWDEGNASQSSVDLRYRYMPETTDHRPTSLFFPLYESDQALATAQRLRKKFRMGDVVSFLPENLEKCDHPTFEINTSEDIVNRVGSALSMSMLKYAVSRPDKMECLEEGWLAKMSDMFHDDNPVIGRGVDYAAELPALVKNFLKTSTFKYGVLTQMNTAHLRKVLPLVLEMLDDMPISLYGLDSGTSLTAG